MKPWQTDPEVKLTVLMLAAFALAIALTMVFDMGMLG